MKINIGPYKNWFGPYQLAEKLCFWAKKETDEYGIERKPKWVHNFGEYLATGRVNDDKSLLLNDEDDEHKTLLYRFMLWVDSKRKRREYIRIDEYDTWNMDRTLAMIILPMLKQLKDCKHGSPHVDLDDVPEHLRLVYTGEHNYQQLALDLGDDTDMQSFSWGMIHKRWEWVLDEMIWAFEQHQSDCDWEAQYTSGNYDMHSEPCDWDDEGKPKLYRLVEGPNHTAKIDLEGRAAHQNRINNGFRLFGKYYQGLWD